jgi:hypothetical protein
MEVITRTKNVPKKLKWAKWTGWEEAEKREAPTAFVGVLTRVHCEFLEHDVMYTCMLEKGANGWIRYHDLRLIEEGDD